MTTSTFLEIDIGVAPNDGTGDPIRDAFDKINKNFGTLFTSTSLVTVSGLKLTDLTDTPKTYTFTVPPRDGTFILTSSNTSPLNTYTNKYLTGENDIRVVQTGSNVVVSHLYTATTASIANTLVLRDSNGNISGGGFNGSTGFTGSRGFTGSIGIQGPLGFTGSVGGGGGSTGTQGPIGFTGSAGEGSSVGEATAGYVAVYDSPYTVTGNSNFTYSGGTVSAIDFVASSDQNLKTVVDKLSNVLENLKVISGVKFKWNQNAREIGILSEKVQIGVLAQDVAKVYPEIVDTHNGYLSVSYDKLVPILLEAIKEQQLLISQQQEQINRLERLIVERP
jgi:hypothetical protein